MKIEVPGTPDLSSMAHEPKRFGLVSLFNGVSTFMGYLMLKPFS